MMIPLLTQLIKWVFLNWQLSIVPPLWKSLQLRLYFRTYTSEWLTWFANGNIKDACCYLEGKICHSLESLDFNDTFINDFTTWPSSVSSARVLTLLRALCLQMGDYALDPGLELPALPHDPAAAPFWFLGLFGGAGESRLYTLSLSCSSVSIPLVLLTPLLSFFATPSGKP